MGKVYSMTGYGKFKSKNFDFLLKSYNSKFLDLTIQMPDFLFEKEEEVKEILNESLRRGKVYFKISLNSFDFPFNLNINKNLLKKIVLEFKEIDPELKSLPLNLIQKENLFIMKIEVGKKYSKELINGVKKTIKLFLKSREEEGKKLKVLIFGFLKEMEGILKKISKKLNEINEEILLDLKEKIKELLKEIPVEEEKILKEASFLSLKMDAREEVDRMIFFVEKIKNILKGKGVVEGKEIDFLIQEVLRETQTFLQKVKNLNLKEEGLKLKLICEKLREQVQNIE